METIEKIRRRMMNSSNELAKLMAQPFYQKEFWPYDHEDLYHFSAKSVGKEMVHYLDVKGFKLVKNYELHDVKHILTGSEMNPLGEIRLSAISTETGTTRFLPSFRWDSAFLSSQSISSPFIGTWRPYKQKSVAY